MQSLKIYTANFSGYDVVHDPECIDHDYVCFTDTPTHFIGRGVWKPIIRPIEQETPQLEARWYKLHSHKLFPHTEWTLYVDASLELHRCPLDFMEWCHVITGKSDCDMYLFTHPERDCLYQEAEACIRLKKAAREKVEPQVAKYRAAGFPEHAGLWMGGVLWRKNTPQVKQFNELWWWEMIHGSDRDQIPLPAVLAATKLQVGSLPPERLTDWFTWRADHSR
jgi:hypothetical protein